MLRNGPQCIPLIWTDGYLLFVIYLTRWLWLFSSFVSVEKEQQYPYIERHKATLVRSYYGDGRSDECTKIDLNKRTAIYVPNVPVEQHTKISKTAMFMFDSLPGVSRPGPKFKYSVRIFVNKGRNFVENCHHRIYDNSEMEYDEIRETSQHLNNKYFRIEIGDMLQKIFSSLYWRYGMSLVIYLEPAVTNMPMVVDETFPLEPSLWSLYIPNQPGMKCLL